MVMLAAMFGIVRRRKDPDTPCDACECSPCDCGWGNY